MSNLEPQTREPATRNELIARTRPDTLRYRLRDRAIALVLPCALFVVRWLPRWTFAPLVRATAALYRGIARRDRRILRANLEYVLELDPTSSEFRSLRRRVTQQQLACGLETVRERLAPGTVALEGEAGLAALFDDVGRAGKGFVLVTGHLGSWELVIGAVARAVNGRFHVIVKPSRIAPVTSLLTRLRERVGAGVLWKDDRGLPRQILRALARGDGVGFAMDQKPRWYQGPVVDFFGLPTEFVGGPATLAARTQCPVVAVFCVRTAPFRYRLLAEQLFSAEHGESDTLVLTQRMASAIENAIRAHLDQWCWTYKRWLFDAQGQLRRGGVHARRAEKERAEKERLAALAEEGEL